MENLLFQFGGDNIFSWVIWIIFIMIFFLFYPRIMLSQIMWKLERVARELEIMSNRSKAFIAKEINKNPDKKIKDSINMFFEFFMISPVSLDPAGVIGKFDHLIQNQKDRFRYFVKQIAPKADKEKQASLEMGFAGGITVHTIAKIVRHYVEIVKKTKSVQIAMVLHMQLPLIERTAKAMYKGTKALTKGQPIGDGLGPLVIASLMENKKVKEIEDEILMAKTKINDRGVFLLKAKGPGGRIGSPGKAVEKLTRNNKIARIITIDAAAKLEGEKSGSIAEGVGVAMGGVGVERSYIEGVAVKKGIPLDSVVVKMSQEEAIQPMRKVIKDALPEVKKSLERSLMRTKKGDKVIVVGVGNTSGIGNSSKDIKKTEEWIEENEKKIKAMEKERKKEHKY